MRFQPALAPDADSVPPSLSQSRLYARVLGAMGHKMRRLPLGDCGEARLILRGPGGRVALMPGGPRWQNGATLTDRRAALRALPRLMRREGIACLITNCASPLEERILAAAGHLPLITGGHEARLDLTAPGLTRRAQLQGKWRNRLVRAEGAGIDVRRAVFDPAAHGWLLEAEAAQRRARGYRGLPLGFAALAARQAPEQVRLFIAMRGGERLGAMLFLIHEGAASYHIGHLAPAGRALAAHNLILWQAADWLAARGIARLDLGPVETEQAPGLARFKLGCGAVPVPRGASCLYTALTALPGRWAARLTRKASHGFAVRNGLSCR